MNYVDATLIRLADPATRAGIFDSTALEQIVSAAYDTDAMLVDAPFQPVFDELHLGFAVPKVAVVDGRWRPVGGIEQTEARFHITGLGSNDVIQVDALWRGRIVARTVSATGRITAVEIAWPSLGTIDAEIEEDLGALPADPAALESERRSRLLQRIRAELDQNIAFPDTALDAWLQRIGASSVGDLVTRFQGTVQPGAMRITLAPEDAGPPSPKSLPFTAALLVRDTGFSVAQLLMESKIVREQLAPMSLEVPSDPTVRVRRSLLVVWIVPATVFDDADWPGATPEARRAAAGQWLAREGIGLVVTPAP